MQLCTAYYLPTLIFCSWAPLSTLPFTFPSPALLASSVPYSLVLFFKPGAQGFVAKHEVLVVNDNRFDPNVGHSVGCFRSHHDSYSAAKRFNQLLGEKIIHLPSRSPYIYVRVCEPRGWLGYWKGWLRYLFATYFEVNCSIGPSGYVEDLLRDMWLER